MTALTREVTQTITMPNDDVPGNCMQAAFASLLNLPLDAVPHFALFETEWREILYAWLSRFDLTLDAETTDQWPDDLAVVAGTSPRGLGHVVLAEHGEVKWDPHPDRTGLVTVDEVWRIRWVG